MLFAKKYLLSFLIIASLGILQFNMIVLIKPALADSTLLSNQSLLVQSGDASYGTHKRVEIIVLDLIKTALSFLALLFVILIIIAGFKYMTSAGNEEKIKEAMGQIQALAIGLLIILASWGGTYWLLRTLVCVTSTSGTVCNPW